MEEREAGAGSLCQGLGADAFKARWADAEAARKPSDDVSDGVSTFLGALMGFVSPQEPDRWNVIYRKQQQLAAQAKYRLDWDLEEPSLRMRSGIGGTAFFPVPHREDKIKAKELGIASS